MASALLQPSSQTLPAPASVHALSPGSEAAMLAAGFLGLVVALEAKASTMLVDARGSLWLEGVVASMDLQVLVAVVCTVVALACQAMDMVHLVVAWVALGASTKSPSTRAF